MDILFDLPLLLAGPVLIGAIAIFISFALDRPYRGDLGSKPTPREFLDEQLMAE